MTKTKSSKLAIVLVAGTALLGISPARADDCACDRYLAFLSQYRLADSAVAIGAHALSEREGSYDVDAQLAATLLRDIRSDANIPEGCRAFVAAHVRGRSDAPLKLGGLQKPDPFNNPEASEVKAKIDSNHPAWDTIAYATGGIMKGGSPMAGAGVSTGTGDSVVDLSVNASTGQPQLQLKAGGQYVPVEIKALDRKNGDGTSSLAINVFPMLKGAAELDVGTLSGAQVRLSPEFAVKFMGDVGKKLVYSVTFHAGPMAGAFNEAERTASASVIGVGLEGGFDGKISYRLDKNDSLDLAGSFDAFRGINDSALVNGMQAQGGLFWKHNLPEGRSVSFGPVVSYSLMQVQGESAVPKFEVAWTGLSLVIHF